MSLAPAESLAILDDLIEVLLVPVVELGAALEARHALQCEDLGGGDGAERIEVEKELRVQLVPSVLCIDWANVADNVPHCTNLEAEAVHVGVGGAAADAEELLRVVKDEEGIFDVDGRLWGHLRGLQRVVATFGRLWLCCGPAACCGVSPRLAGSGVLLCSKPLVALVEPQIVLGKALGELVGVHVPFGNQSWRNSSTSVSQGFLSIHLSVRDVHFAVEKLRTSLFVSVELDMGEVALDVAELGHHEEYDVGELSMNREHMLVQLYA